MTPTREKDADPYCFLLTKQAEPRYPPLPIKPRPLLAGASICGSQSNPFPNWKSSTAGHEPKSCGITWRHTSSTAPPTTPQHNILSLQTPAKRANALVVADRAATE